MAEYDNDFRNCQTVEDLKLKLNRFFEWFFANLDSLNITSITTELTKVQSQAGETQIQGPVLVMYDKQAVPVLRLKMGYDSVSSDFIFRMFDKLGALTIGQDSTTGGATFTGTITGGTIRTAATGERVELSGNQLKSYNSANQLSGLVTNATTGPNYGDVSFFDSGVEVAKFYNLLTGLGYSLRPMGTAALFLGMYGKTTRLEGNIKHIDNIGFFGATPVAKTAVANPVDSTNSNLYTALNNLINVLKGYGLV